MTCQTKFHRTLSNINVDNYTVSFFGYGRWEDRNKERTYTFNNSEDALYFIIDNKMKIKSIITSGKTATINIKSLTNQPVGETK